MLTEDKIGFVKDVLSKKSEVATKELLQAGYDNNDIVKLKKIGIIESSRWGYYKLVDVSKFYADGLEFLENKDYENARLMFEKSLEVSFKVTESTYYLFLLNVLSGDYDLAFRYFDVLYDTPNNIIGEGDLKFYLYLINFYRSVPEKYYQMVRYMKLGDTINDNKNLIPSQLKAKCFSFRFIDVRNEIPVNKDFHLKVLHSILSKVITSLSKEKKQFLNLTLEKKYEDVSRLYSEIESYRDLTGYEKNCFLVVEEIVQIFKMGGVLPKANKVLTDRLVVAIENKDYKRALEISTKYNNSKGIDNKLSQINLLLEAINEIIYNPSFIKCAKEDTIKDDTYNKLIECLFSGNIDDFTINLKDYLTNNNLLEYLFLILNLVKIDSILDDKLYSNTMLKLSLIKNNSFTFDTSEYVMKFYETLALKRYEEASIYLDIIENASKMKLSNISFSCFRTMYERYVNGTNSLFSGLTCDLKARKRYTFEDLGIQYSMEDLISNKVLMLPANIDIEHIKEVVKDLENVSCFEINIDGQIRVMLKYKSKVEDEGVSLAIKL